jgi:hypothetical protein
MKKKPKMLWWAWLVAAMMCLVIHLIENVLSFFAPHPLKLAISGGIQTVLSCTPLNIEAL